MRLTASLPLLLPIVLPFHSLLPFSLCCSTQGDQCEFLHEYNLRAMPECHWYLKYGYCSAGDECLYFHPRQKKKVCQDYQRGFCWLGELLLVHPSPFAVGRSFLHYLFSSFPSLSLSSPSHPPPLPRPDLSTLPPAKHPLPLLPHWILPPRPNLPSRSPQSSPPSTRTLPSTLPSPSRSSRTAASRLRKILGVRSVEPDSDRVDQEVGGPKRAAGRWRRRRRRKGRWRREQHEGSIDCAVLVSEKRALGRLYSGLELIVLPLNPFSYSKCGNVRPLFFLFFSEQLFYS
jgi:hypothetical protein